MLGQILLERLDDRAHLPDEDARVPEELAALEEGLRQLQTGLLGEALDLAHGLRVRHLDVSVARVGPRGLDAHGQQRVVLRGEGEALADDRAEVLLVEDQMIRRRDNHLRLGVAAQQRIGRIGDAGRRVAAHGFAQHLSRAQLGKVFEHQILVFAIGHHEEVLGRDDLRETFVGVTDERFAGSQNVEELLGHRLPALGPETGADAARHDDAIFAACHEL